MKNKQILQRTELCKLAPIAAVMLFRSAAYAAKQIAFERKAGCAFL